jgi:transcriptional regulator GlxA family with amidase domain
MRRIVFVGFEQALLLDVAGPLQVFATARDICAARGLPDPYEVLLTSRSDGAVVTSAGLAVSTVPLAALDGLAIDTLVVVGGIGSRAAAQDSALIQWIAARAARTRRLCSVCTGAFVLAAAGLLDGRRATTHWAAVDELRRRFPQIRVESDPIFLRDGKAWTSAGVTAGIDLALALVEEDLGRDVALAVARHLVVFLKRPGGQSQFSAMLAAQSMGDQDFAALHGWMAQHLGEDLRVERLAQQVGMSPRNFARRYAASTGTTPAKEVERLRVETARRALEESAAPVAAVARHCGFGNEERMRRSFLRHLGVAPKQYRARFSRPEGSRTVAQDKATTPRAAERGPPRRARR